MSAAPSENPDAAPSRDSAPPVPRLRTVLARGARKRCPHCGRGPIFEGWVDTRERCPECGYRFEMRAGDSFGFVYMSAAVITGLCGVVVFLVHAPRDLFETAILLAIFLPLMFGSMPLRKGLAVGLDYYQRRIWPDPDDVFPALPEDRRGADS